MINRKSLPGVRALAIEGGGVNGMAYIEPVRDLEIALGDGGLRNLGMVAGTSAGAITALAIALGYTAAQIGAIVEATPWDKFPSGKATGVFRFLGRGGFHSLNYAREWLERLVEQAPRDLELGTLQELDVRYGIRLAVCAVDEWRAKLQVWDSRDTPDVPIVDAVLSSMAIPVYWPPVWIEGRPYSDGGLLANHPMDLLASAGYSPRECLGLRVDRGREVSGEGREYRWRSVIGRSLQLLMAASGHAQSSHVPSELWPRVVRINVGTSKATNFDISDDRRLELAAAGRRAMDEWLDRGGSL